MHVGTLVTLDGSESFDNDTDPLTYAWTLTSALPADSTATLSGSTTVHPTFTPDKPGDYVIQLIVNDGYGNSDPATVTSPPSPLCSPSQAPRASRWDNRSNSRCRLLILTEGWSAAKPSPLRRRMREHLTQALARPGHLEPRPSRSPQVVREVGRYVATGSFDGNAYTSNALVVTAANPTYNLTLEQPSGAPEVTVEEPFSLTARLTDSGQNPLGDQSIDVYDQSGTNRATAVTNAIGEANFTLAETSPGQHVYHAAATVDGVGVDSAACVVTVIAPNVPILTLTGLPQGVANQPFTLTAILRNSDGSPNNGEPGFHLYDEHGVLRESDADTVDFNGVATFTLSETDAGEHAYHAVISFNDQEYASNEFHVTITASAAYVFNLTGPDYATTGQPFQLMATLKDANGTAVVGQLITFARFDSDNNSWTTVGTATTGSDGTATLSTIASESDYTPVRYHATFTANGSPYVSAEVSVVLHGPLSEQGFNLAGPSSATPGQSFTLSATLKDQNGNPIPNQAVILYRWNSSYGTFDDIVATVPTDANGVADFQVTENAAGTQQYQASTDVGASTYTSNTKTVYVQNPAVSFALTAPLNITAGTPFTLSATLKDQNNPIPNQAIVLYRWNSSYGTFDDVVATVPTDANGVADFQVTENAAGTQQYQAYTYSYYYYESYTSNSVTVIVQNPTPTFTLTAPSTATAGTALHSQRHLNGPKRRPHPESSRVALPVVWEPT